MKYTFFLIFSFINNEVADRVIRWKISQRHNDTFLRSLLDCNFSAIDSMKGSPNVGPTKYHSVAAAKRTRSIYILFSLNVLSFVDTCIVGETGPTVLQRDTSYNYM